MKKKLFYVCAVLALISLLVGATVFFNKQDELFYKNLEALAIAEDPSLTFECDPGSPVVYCERICLHCFRTWRTDGKSGRFVRSLDYCICGSDLN